jgi:hypothetical protein
VPIDVPLMPRAARCEDRFELQMRLRDLELPLCLRFAK